MFRWKRRFLAALLIWKCSTGKLSRLKFRGWKKSVSQNFIISHYRTIQGTTELTIIEKGMPISKKPGTFGDMILTIKTTFPQKLAPADRQRLADFL
jgi:DnaJ-class molecular chaperone